MTCRECQDLMLEVARDRAAPFVRQTVLAHTEFCSACSTCLDRERALTAGLRSVALEGASSSPSADLESGLLKAFESHHRDCGPMQYMDAPATRTLPGRWLPVAAAVALCAAGLTWWLTSSKDVPAPPPVIAAVQKLAQPIQVPAPPIQGVDPVRTDRIAAGHSARPARRASRPAVRPPIQPVGFVPIPSAAGLPEFESGQIVRLGIPVTALPNYGVEIPPGSVSAIQADLLVGQDGQPRAIRLVNANAQDSHHRQ
jgi:hypothetical protein